MHTPIQPAVRNAIVRIDRACAAKGESRSAYYANAASGLDTKPVKISARAAGLPAHEIEAVNAARIAGKSDDEIRALVQRLHAARLIGLAA
jgi:prophage regulatory protein